MYIYVHIYIYIIAILLLYSHTRYSSAFAACLIYTYAVCYVETRPHTDARMDTAVAFTYLIRNAYFGRGLLEYLHGSAYRKYKYIHAETHMHTCMRNRLHLTCVIDFQA